MAQMKLSILRIQVELISNTASVEEVSHKQSNAVYEKDYYALVMDDLDKV